MGTTGSIHYFDSHGCKISFLVREENMPIALKKRKFVYVLPEVLEIIERTRLRGGYEITLVDVSLELCIHPIIIHSVFAYLKHIGLLDKREGSSRKTCAVPGMKPAWINNSFTILRAVTEEDYGKNVKSKKEKVAF